MRETKETIDPGPPPLHEAADPDPFTVGIGIFSCIAAGGAFLEARRSRALSERQRRGEFRRCWYRASRTVIRFEHAVDEFETYVLEDGYASNTFRIGAVRLTLDPGRKEIMKAFMGQTLQTADDLANDLDDLSEFLGREYHQRVLELIERLSEIHFPGSYADLVTAARGAVGLYDELLSEIGLRERFDPRTAA